MSKEKGSYNLYINHNNEINKDRSSVNGIYIGEKVYYTLQKKSGVVTDLYQDGDAGVDFDDGTSSYVKWIYLVPLYLKDSLEI